MKWRKALRDAVYGRPFVAAFLTRHFHRLYYYQRERTWRNTTWLGTDILKCPLDVWVYQEILHEVRPDLVIETGTFSGGSAAYLASLFDILGKGRIVSIDAAPQAGRPQHPRITYVDGISTDPTIVERVRAELAPGDRVLVLLDSDHSQANVAAELRTYAGWVSVGSYCVVEDSNVNGFPVSPEFGPGPMEAIRAFVADDERFEIDRSREKFFLTFNPSGYLRRVR